MITRVSNTCTPTPKLNFESRTMLSQPFISYVAERDVDLMLLEELNVSIAFREWFTSRFSAEPTRWSVFLGAWHSVVHSELGESDLVCLLADSQGSRHALLIENKIDAPAQTDQCARYRKRGEAGVRDGTWTSFQTVIVAPDSYLNSKVQPGDYDTQIKYEMLHDWFESGHLDHARSKYRAKVLKSAIEQQRRGYQHVPDPAVTAFWQGYWSLVQADYPHLAMRRPGQVAAGSDWPEFRNSALGKGRKIVHKLQLGVVDLQIDGASAKVDAIASVNARALGTEFSVVVTGKSAAVRVHVPAIDRCGSLLMQEVEVRRGLEAASRLLALSPTLTMP